MLSTIFLEILFIVNTLSEPQEKDALLEQVLQVPFATPTKRCLLHFVDVLSGPG
jgi:hypothetical protein